MKDIDVLKHTSVDHLPLTGGTLTGDLIIKKNDGSAGKLQVHRTLRGNDIQGSFDVYDVGVAGGGGNGACALSTNNKTTNQQEACYVFGKSALWSPDRPDNSRPDLGATDYPFKDSYFNGNMSIDTSTGEKKIAFFDGQTRKSYFFGQNNGKIGCYDSVNNKSIWTYEYTNANDTQVGFSTQVIPTVNNSYDLGNTAKRWRNSYVENIFTSSLGRVGGGTIRMDVSLDGNGKNLGWSQSKFQQLVAVNVFADNVQQGSDIKLKENIRYIDAPKKISKDVKDETITKEELFDFVKNLKVCEYNYIESDKDKIGFIANDVVGDKIGDKVVSNHIEEIKEVTEEGEEVVVGTEETLTYDVTNMLFATIGALQEEIRKREELEDRLKKIEEKLGI